jgi:hypothetical protein
MDELIDIQDIVVRKVTGGYEIVKNRFSETGYMSEVAFAALRKTYPSARVMVL